jgi:hypothetical protein
MRYWGLILCDMRAPRIEEGDRLAAWAETETALLDLMESERVQPYTDEGWHKTFRKGGPLEWFNPYNSVGRMCLPMPSPEEAAEHARTEQQAMLDATHKV